MPYTDLRPHHGPLPAAVKPHRLIFDREPGHQNGRPGCGGFAAKGGPPSGARTTPCRARTAGLRRFHRPTPAAQVSAVEVYVVQPAATRALWVRSSHKAVGHLGPGSY